MDSFHFPQEAVPLPKLESQPIDLSFIKPRPENFDEPFYMMDNPSGHSPTIMQSPVHVDLTGPFVDWGISPLPFDSPPAVMRSCLFRPQPLRIIPTGIGREPFAPPPSAASDNGFEVIHEWNRLQEQRMMQQSPPGSATFPVQEDFQVAGPSAKRIKLEDESSSPSSSDNSVDNTPIFTSLGIHDFPHALERPTTSRKATRRQSETSARTSQPTGRRRTNPNRVKAALPSHSALSEDQLSVKSNYEHIVDGTGPDMKYPDGFTAKVLSKRIAHKLSEKSRRNRLTTAIRQIEKLLPPEMLSELREPRKGSANGPDPTSGEADVPDKAPRPTVLPISKVDIAELALEYIGKLQQDLKNAKEEVVSKSCRCHGDG